MSIHREMHCGPQELEHINPNPASTLMPIDDQHDDEGNSYQVTIYRRPAHGETSAGPLHIGDQQD